MSKRILTFVVCFLFSGILLIPPVVAQQPHSVYPNGFHLGLTGQGFLSPRQTVVPFGDMPAPIFKAGFGWKSGLEVSYHFYDYYGVSVGFDYGTAFRFKSELFFPSSQFFSDGEDRYIKGGKGSICRFQLPIKFEFHYPFKRGNWIFCASVGANLTNILENVGYAKTKTDVFSVTWEHNITIFESGETAFISRISERFSDVKAYKIRADLIFDMGVCYRLPYSDLIRATIVVNHVFKDHVLGYYDYPQDDDSWGIISGRNSYVGLELSYIHCFKNKRGKLKVDQS